MNLIMREKWGMKPPKKNYDTHTPKGIILHHVGSSDGGKIIPSFKGVESVKGIERYHTVTGHKWNAIGYHYLIAPNGDIYECRPPNVVGAHCGGHNTGNIGINVWGNMDYESPTLEQKFALIELIRHLNEKFPAIKWNVKGHRDYGSTSCPGQNLYEQINEITSNAKLQQPKKELEIVPKIKGFSVISKSGNVQDTQVDYDAKLLDAVQRIEIIVDARTGKSSIKLTILDVEIEMLGLEESTDDN